MDGTINNEMLVREQPVTLAEKLDSEIEVTPTPQLSRIQIAAPQVTVFRLGGREHVGLIFRFEDEELPTVFLQKSIIHFLRSRGSSGMSIAALDT